MKKFSRLQLKRAIQFASGEPPIGEIKTVKRKQKPKDIENDQRDMKMRGVEFMIPKGYRRPLIYDGSPRVEGASMPMAGFVNAKAIVNDPAYPSLDHTKPDVIKASKGGIIHEQSLQKHIKHTQKQFPRKTGEGMLAHAARVAPAATAQKRSLRGHEISHSLIQHKRGRAPESFRELLGEETKAYTRQFMPNVAKGKYKKALTNAVKSPIKSAVSAIQAGVGIPASMIIGRAHIKRFSAGSQPGKTKRKRGEAIDRLRNALIVGTAGGYLGDMIGPSDSKSGARAGVAIGALVGALSKRRKTREAASTVSGGGEYAFDFKGFRKEHQNPNGGLNAKGRAAYNKATGSDLKRPQPEGGKRRDSFCARMKGMKAKLTSEKTARDPDSRINKSLRAWNCEALVKAIELAKRENKPSTLDQIVTANRKTGFKVSSIMHHAQSAGQGAAAGLAIGGLLAGRKGVTRKTAAVGAIAGLASRAAMQPSQRRRHEEDLKKKGFGGVKADIKTSLRGSVPQLAASAITVGALLGRNKINKAAKVVGKKVRAVGRLARQKGYLPKKTGVTRTRGVPRGNGPIIDADTGKVLPQLMGRFDFAEKRDKTSKVRDVAIGAGALMAGGAAIHAARKVGRSSEAIAKSIQGITPKSVASAIGAEAEKNAKRAVQSGKSRIANAVRKLKWMAGLRARGFDVTLDNVREFAHYPAYHPLYQAPGDETWEGETYKPARRKAQTPEEHEEVRRDRQALVRGAIKGAAIAAPLAYVFKDSPGGLAAQKYAKDVVKRAKSGFTKKKSYPALQGSKPITQSTKPTSIADFYAGHSRPTNPWTTTKGMKADSIQSLKKPAVKRTRVTSAKKTVAKKAPVKKVAVKKTKLSAIIRKMIEFGGQQQILNKQGRRYADPIKVAVGIQQGVIPEIDANGEKIKDRFKENGVWKTRVRMKDVDLPVHHGQVVRTVYKKAHSVAKWSDRTGGLAKDVTDTVRGIPREKDAYGRRKKREWEKGWFKRAATGAAIGTAGLAVLKSDKGKALVKKGLINAEKVKRSILPDLSTFGDERRIMSLVRGIDSALNYFDETAPNWDIRHESASGKSARVYAPESKPRNRRQKRWHERLENERKLWAAGLVGTAAISAIGTKKISGALAKRASQAASKVKAPTFHIPRN